MKKSPSMSGTKEDHVTDEEKKRRGVTGMMSLMSSKAAPTEDEDKSRTPQLETRFNDSNQYSDMNYSIHSFIPKFAAAKLLEMQNQHASLSILNQRKSPSMLEQYKMPSLPQAPGMFVPNSMREVPPLNSVRRATASPPNSITSATASPLKSVTSIVPPSNSITSSAPQIPMPGIVPGMTGIVPNMTDVAPGMLPFTAMKVMPWMQRHFREPSLMSVGTLPDINMLSGLLPVEDPGLFESNMLNIKRMYVMEKSEAGYHVCSMCLQPFPDKATLDRHNRAFHMKMDEYTCAVCMKSFSKKSRLKRHFLTHTGRRPHQCTYCKKSFAQKSDLVMHVRIHTGERPFECKICKKRFTQKVHLNVHTRVHTGKRPYKCKVCNKSFATKANLKSHSRIHLAEKSYSCGVCNIVFAQKSQLTMHMKIHRTAQIAMPLMQEVPEMYAKAMLQPLLPPPPIAHSYHPVVPDSSETKKNRNAFV